jgi:hypothetical protein
MKAGAEAMWEELKGEVRRRQAGFDAEIDAWLADFAGGRIRCGRGCRSCCSLAVNCTLTEALLVAGTLTGGQAAALAGHVARLRPLLSEATDLRTWLRLHRQVLGACPFLGDDGACGVYAVRPFSCRALLSTRPPEWCGADFAALHPLERQAFLGSLDRSVVAYPTHYVAATGERGRELEEEAAGRMATRLGASVTGNLPLLVWLAREHRFAEVLAAEPGEAAALLAREELRQPFLVSLDLLS